MLGDRLGLMGQYHQSQGAIKAGAAGARGLSKMIVSPGDLDREIGAAGEQDNRAIGSGHRPTDGGNPGADHPGDQPDDDPDHQQADDPDRQPGDD